MNYTFDYDKRLGIDLPVLNVPFESLDEDERGKFFKELRAISASIPEKIKLLDEEYMEKYEELEKDIDNFYEIMDELNDISKKISELNVWFLKIEGHFIQQD